MSEITSVLDTGPAPGPAPENPKNVVQSVAKAFAVLRAFSPDEPELTLSEVAARAGLDRGTAFRLIQTLVGLGYLRPVAGSRRYRLALKCLELGFSALSARDLRVHAAPLLREAVPELADAGSLGVLERGEVIYLERVHAGLDRSGPHGLDRRPGSRTGAYASALGHALLAWLPRDEQVSHLEATARVKLSDRTLTDLDGLLARLEEVRAKGFAVSDGENAYGLRTVAAPVLGVDGAPLAALSLTIQASRGPIEAFTAEAAPAVRRMAGELTAGIRLSLGAIGVPGRAR